MSIVSGIFEEENKQVLAYKDAPIDKGEQIFVCY